jgi:hypothetical protein
MSWRAGQRITPGQLTVSGVQVTLSDTTPGVDWVNFGSQFAAFPNPGHAVTVDARVSSYSSRISTTAANAGIRLQVSLDGGATWSTGNALRARAGFAEGAVRLSSMISDHLVSGVPTGQIRVRAQVINFDQSTNTLFAQGRIIARMFPQ